MATLVDRLLDAAEALIISMPRSSAARRRAVSTAYYAVFHSLMKLCADELASERERSDAAYKRVYRSLEHGPAKKAFSERRSPLFTEPRLREIGDSFVTLQSKRNQADYDPPRSDHFPLREAEQLLADSRAACRKISELRPEDRRTMAIYLLFKDRPQEEQVDRRAQQAAPPRDAGA